jgi:hypothetical protein
MIHFSCDRCGRRISSDEEARYVVRIEVEVVLDSSHLEAFDEDDRDHLLEIHELLEQADDLAEPLMGSGGSERQRFDLCEECHAKYLRNPLGKEIALKQMDFSQN